MSATGSEEHENMSGETDRLYETLQKVIAALPFLAASSIVPLAVFAILAIRYHSHFMAYLALWFLVLGSQTYIIFESHKIGSKMEEHCCDGTDNSVNMILWIILIAVFSVLPIIFFEAEPAFIGKINTIELYMDAVIALSTIFLFIVWLLDTVYMIYEVMPIRED